MKRGLILLIAIDFVCILGLFFVFEPLFISIHTHLIHRLFILLNIIIAILSLFSINFFLHANLYAVFIFFRLRTKKNLNQNSIILF